MTRWLVVVVGIMAARVVAADPVVVTKAPLGLGCFARSANGDTLACVIGTSGNNVGSSAEMLVFARAAGAAPEAIPLFTELVQVSPGPDELPPKVVATITAALRGYVTIETTAPAIHLADGKVSPAITVGGLGVTLRASPAKAVGSAPAYRTVLTVTRGRVPEVLDTRTASTSGMTVTAFALGKAVVIELTARIADEGTYGSSTLVWLCTSDRCRPVT